MRSSLTCFISRFFGLCVSFGVGSQASAVGQVESSPVLPSVQEHALLPSHAAVSLGLGLRPRLLFGQESFYQENWNVSVAAHWQCRVFQNCELLGRVWYQRSLQMPETTGDLGVNRTEAELGVDVGLESRALFLSGLAFGVVSTERKYALNLDANINNKSGAKDFREVVRWPSARIWLGVPLWLEACDVIVSINRLFSNDSEVEKQTYASELRFRF